MQISTTINKILPAERMTGKENLGVGKENLGVQKKS